MIINITQSLHDTSNNSVGCGLLWCDAIQSCMQLPTFQTNIPLQSSDFHSEDGGNTLLWNDGNHLQDYMTSQPKIWQSYLQHCENLKSQRWILLKLYHLMDQDIMWSILFPCHHFIKITFITNTFHKPNTHRILTLWSQSSSKCYLGI
jgi:hypothetical protein